MSKKWRMIVMMILILIFLMAIKFAVAEDLFKISEDERKEDLIRLMKIEDNTQFENAEQEREEDLIRLMKIEDDTQFENAEQEREEDLIRLMEIKQPLVA